MKAPDDIKIEQKVTIFFTDFFLWTNIFRIFTKKYS